MTIFQRLVKAADEFYRIAPVQPRAELTTNDELVSAFRRFRYWSMRSVGETSRRAKWKSAVEAEELRSGWYDAAFATLDRRDQNPAEQVAERFNRRPYWEEHRKTARWYANEASRIGWIPTNR